MALGAVGDPKGASNKPAIHLECEVEKMKEHTTTWRARFILRSIDRPGATRLCDAGRYRWAKNKDTVLDPMVGFLRRILRLDSRLMSANQV